MPPMPPIYRPPKPGATPTAKPLKTALRSGDANRPHSRARGYDRTWERLRRMHLNDNPFCVMCLEMDHVRRATVVDHRTPITVDPSLRLVPSNLQSLCKPHHDGRKQREDARARRGQNG